MLCLRGFELYSRWVPLPKSLATLVNAHVLIPISQLLSLFLTLCRKVLIQIKIPK